MDHSSRVGGMGIGDGIRGTARGTIGIIGITGEGSGLWVLGSQHVRHDVRSGRDSVLLATAFATAEAFFFGIPIRGQGEDVGIFDRRIGPSFTAASPLACAQSEYRH